MSSDPIASFVAGGCAGAIATVVTCPLEVVKTRLQSTVGQDVLRMYRFIPEHLPLSPAAAGTSHGGVYGVEPSPRVSQGAHSISYFRHMVLSEGVQSLFKGLTPSLVGSVPTRALYFCAYSQFKSHYNTIFTSESSLVHLCSAVSAGIMTTTVTSPIWVVKTQMQLDNRPGQLLTAKNCARQIFKLDGVKGFYRGLTASYAGVVETGIHFVLYEKLKRWMVDHSGDQRPKAWHYMIAAAVARMSASCLCYPHEVCRTRLRQKTAPSQRRYHNFLQTLLTVGKEEGAAGLYGGMSAHLIRVIPYQAIMFCSYETIIRLISYYRNIDY